MKKAIIVGAKGQDGRFLNDLLVRKGYGVIGISEDAADCSIPGIAWTQLVDIRKQDDVSDLINAVMPDEIYYLAAYHHSSEDAPAENIELMDKSYSIHVHSLLNFLEAIRRYSNRTRLFYAASSLVFGNVSSEPQDENTPFNPACFYSITKAAGVYACRVYRNKHALFASAGILYNHESAYRSDRFVSSKIIRGAVDIRNGSANKIVLGNLNAAVDWGYAPDYVKAFHRILNAETPDDFVVATGRKHTVSDFVKIAFEALGLDWKPHVEENRQIINRQGAALVGNPEKLMKTTGWSPSVDFVGMIRLLLKAEGAELDDNSVCD